MKKQEESQLKRDQMLVQVIKEIQENKRLAAATKDELENENYSKQKEKRNFLKDLFRKKRTDL
jgi:hypothetical protein